MIPPSSKHEACGLCSVAESNRLQPFRSCGIYPAIASDSPPISRGSGRNRTASSLCAGIQSRRCLGVDHELHAANGRGHSTDSRDEPRILGVFVPESTVWHSIASRAGSRSHLLPLRPASRLSGVFGASVPRLPYEMNATPARSVCQQKVFGQQKRPPRPRRKARAVGA